MATIAQLAAAGKIIRLGGGLLPKEQIEGRIFAFPNVINWFENELPKLDALVQDGLQTATEELDDLLHDFVTGKNLDYYSRSHSMRPTSPGVWELKTPELRLFGWFNLRLTFVVAEIDTATRCKKHYLYPGYRDSVVRKRNELALDEPKFITGSYADVL